MAAARTKTVDWSAADAQCQEVLDANPQALLLPRISCNAPQWWREAHPEDDMVWDSGPQFGYPVVASPAYRRDAAERLAALVTHLEAKFGPHMAGYHPCGQNTRRVVLSGDLGTGAQRICPGRSARLAPWLAERYADDAALRQAWRDPHVSLATAAVPTPAARRAAPAGVLRDPVAERPVIDFTEFQQEAMADCVCHLAHAVREATHGRKLVVFFYGYVFEFGAIAQRARHGRPLRAAARAGVPRHRRALLADLLFRSRAGTECAGHDGRRERGAGRQDVALRRRHAHVPQRRELPGYDRVDDPRRDERGAAAQHGPVCGAQFRHLVDGSGRGRLVRRPAAVGRDDAAQGARRAACWRQPRPFRPEVAAVIDEQSMMRVAAGGAAVTLPGVYQVRRPLGRMGTPYGQYLQDDVIAGKVQAKMYVFLTAWCLAPDRAPSSCWRRRAAACACGAMRPAIRNRTARRSTRCASLTGFQLAKVTPAKALAKPTAAGKQLGLHASRSASTRPINPLFAAVGCHGRRDAGHLSGRFGGDRPAAHGRRPVAVRRRAGTHLRTPAAGGARGGVHLFTQQDCNVYANGPYLVLHASQDGPLEVDTGVPGPIRDLLDDQDHRHRSQDHVAAQEG